MFSDGWDLRVVITDLLWLLVIGGWILLILGGLEADKPLSGGLPGHVNHHEAHDESHWNAMDYLGARVGWIVFGLAAASLPIILWWIFAVHPR